MHNFFIFIINSGYSLGDISVQLLAPSLVVAELLNVCSATAWKHQSDENCDKTREKRLL